jgi:hypothetical protein
MERHKDEKRPHGLRRAVNTPKRNGRRWGPQPQVHGTHPLTVDAVQVIEVHVVRAEVLEALSQLLTNKVARRVERARGVAEVQAALGGDDALGAVVPGERLAHESLVVRARLGDVRSRGVYHEARLHALVQHAEGLLLVRLGVRDCETRKKLREADDQLSAA